MNTEHLVYILEAYKCGSVNKAARNCYISQSHLSTIIKNVEQEIGYPLFHRTANGITATPEGLIFMSHAEKIVTERNNIQKIPQSMSESDSLSIICARSAFVLQCFFDYKNRFPNLNRTHDKFLEAGLRENLKNVVAQNCRLGILVLFEQVIPKYMDLADQYNLEMTVLQRSIPVTALMSKSHPLANSSRVSLKDLTGYPFIADAHRSGRYAGRAGTPEPHRPAVHLRPRHDLRRGPQRQLHRHRHQHSGGCPADELRLLSHRGRRSHGRGPAAFPDIYAPPQREALHSLSD
ncbi:MAG: LysR family transcriptional regulator [Oscillibacter sp.]|uniref:LysR family transcriptional regulator n=1 Tax=Oscillibacter sp. TaxID=1945593 RepID=UPI00132CA594|nr:LysR family transcriptional regulator [Oscillibacter sp.]MUU13046.1 LysR family transcriptional regulator [Oscillibacter sp.]